MLTGRPWRMVNGRTLSKENGGRTQRRFCVKTWLSRRLTRWLSRGSLQSRYKRASFIFYLRYQKDIQPLVCCKHGPRLQRNHFLKRMISLPEGFISYSGENRDENPQRLLMVLHLPLEVAGGVFLRPLTLIRSNSRGVTVNLTSNERKGCVGIHQ